MHDYNSAPEIMDFSEVFELMRKHPMEAKAVLYTFLIAFGLIGFLLFAIGLIVLLKAIGLLIAGLMLMIVGVIAVFKLAPIVDTWVKK
jgi:hypothetical protein